MPTPRPQLFDARTMAPAQCDALRARLDVLPHHPDTPNGQLAYEAQKTAWRQQYGATMSVDDTKPFPLTPGRAGICTGECFHCGMYGHRGQGCTLPPPATMHEFYWRRICGTALRAFRATTPGVRVVEILPDDDPFQSPDITTSNIEAGKVLGSSA